MEERLQKIEEEITAISERNRRVEANKAWEGSFARLFCVALITYVVASFLLYIINAEHIFLGALVPVVGFSSPYKRSPR